MKKTLIGALIVLLLAAFSPLLVDQALANPCPPGNPPTNCAPPTGAILDLNGTPVPHTYTPYSVDFTAGAASTNISFSFREDPAFLGLDDVSVHLTSGGPNLLLNGGFESGVVGGAPVNWTFLNSFGAFAAGVVATGGTPGPHSGSNYFRDGAVQAYDGITQAVATAIGISYTIDFFLSDNGGLTTFSRLSTNGHNDSTDGNGIDLLVYAGVIPTLTSVPEPSTWLLLGSGLAGLAAWRRKKAA